MAEAIPIASTPTGIMTTEGPAIAIGSTKSGTIYASPSGTKYVMSSKTGKLSYFEKKHMREAREREEAAAKAAAEAKGMPIASTPTGVLTTTGREVPAAPKPSIPAPKAGEVAVATVPGVGAVTASQLREIETRRATEAKKLTGEDMKAAQVVSRPLSAFVPETKKRKSVSGLRTTLLQPALAAEIPSEQLYSPVERAPTTLGGRAIQNIAERAQRPGARFMVQEEIITRAPTRPVVTPRVGERLPQVATKFQPAVSEGLVNLGRNVAREQSRREKEVGRIFEARKAGEERIGQLIGIKDIGKRIEERVGGVGGGFAGGAADIVINLAKVTAGEVYESAAFAGQPLARYTVTYKAEEAKRRGAVLASAGIFGGAAALGGTVGIPSLAVTGALATGIGAGVSLFEGRPLDISIGRGLAAGGFAVLAQKGIEDFAKAYGPKETTGVEIKRLVGQERETTIEPLYPEEISKRGVAGVSKEARVQPLYETEIVSPKAAEKIQVIKPGEKVEFFYGRAERIVSEKPVLPKALKTEVMLTKQKGGTLEFAQVQTGENFLTRLISQRKVKIPIEKVAVPKTEQRVIIGLGEGREFLGTTKEVLVPIKGKGGAGADVFGRTFKPTPTKTPLSKTFGTTVMDQIQKSAGVVQAKPVVAKTPITRPEVGTSAFGFFGGGQILSNIMASAGGEAVTPPGRPAPSLPAKMEVPTISPPRIVLPGVIGPRERKIPIVPLEIPTPKISPGVQRRKVTPARVSPLELPSLDLPQSLKPIPQEGIIPAMREGQLPSLLEPQTETTKEPTIPAVSIPFSPTFIKPKPAKAGVSAPSLGGGLGIGRGRGRGALREVGYIGSLGAKVFGVSAKKAPTGPFSGLEFRPIIRGVEKPKKVVSKKKKKKRKGGVLDIFFRR